MTGRLVGRKDQCSKDDKADLFFRIFGIT